MKKVETEIEIEATPDEVWHALTNAEELKRWFPLDARVKPGPGGSVWLSWGEGSDWESPIDLWQPAKRLRTLETMPQPDGAAPLKVAVDYILAEAHGGKTVLRIVHSGFADTTWDDELDTMKSGWASFAANLKHYLERHRGEARYVAFFRHPTVPISRPDAFRRTLSALAVKSPNGLAVGSRYAASIGSGEVRVFAPPINLTGTVEDLHNGWLMVEVEPGRGQCRPAIWLSLYGEAMGRGPEMQERIRGLLEAEFREAATEG